MILVPVLIIAAAAVIVIVAVSVKAASERKSSEFSQMLSYMAERDRVQAEADKESRAMAYYSLQAALSTVQTQANANADALKALGMALDRQGDLEDIRTRAIVMAYTKCLQEKGKEPKKLTSRYWEEAPPDEYI